MEAFHAAKPTAIAPRVAAKPTAKSAPFFRGWKTEGTLEADIP
jgi:hypothetical protein